MYSAWHIVGAQGMGAVIAGIIKVRESFVLSLPALSN